MAQIEWPWQYSFPPFFTLQPHIETQAKQLLAWKNLLLDFLKATKQSTVDIREVHGSPLFNNTAIKRQLSPDVVLMLLEDLSKSNNAYPLDKGKQRWLVSWHSFQEWADIIYNWAQERGFGGSVYTLFELVQGEDTTEQGSGYKELVLTRKEVFLIISEHLSDKFASLIEFMVEKISKDTGRTVVVRF